MASQKPADLDLHCFQKFIMSVNNIYTAMESRVKVQNSQIPELLEL